MHDRSGLRCSPPPRHIAIVMDGNGRWAKSAFCRAPGRPQTRRTRCAADVQACRPRHCRVPHGVRLFSPKTGTARRTRSRPDGPGGKAAVSRYPPRWAKDGVRIRIVGDRESVSDKLRQAWNEAEVATAHNTKRRCRSPFNYGGRWDIVQAARRGDCGGVPADDHRGQAGPAYTAMAHAPDPTCSSVPAARCASATFCCGRRRTPSFVQRPLWPEFDAKERTAPPCRPPNAGLRRFGGWRRRSKENQLMLKPASSPPWFAGHAAARRCSSRLAIAWVTVLMGGAGLGVGRLNGLPERARSVRGRAAAAWCVVWDTGHGCSAAAGRGWPVVAGGAGRCWVAPGARPGPAGCLRIAPALLRWGAVPCGCLDAVVQAARWASTSCCR